MSEHMNPENSVQFSIGLDTVISTEVEYDHEGEIVGHGPVTLGQMVASLVAERISRQINAEMRREYLKPVRERVNEIADRLIEEKLREVLAREIVPTDKYSTTKGEPTTLAEVIEKQAQAWLVAPKNDGYGRTGKSNLGCLIDEAVGRSFQGELQAAVKKAKEQAVETVAQNAGAAMADILRRAAS